MLFNSLAFLVFAPLFLVAFFQTSGKTRLWLCLLGSYLFYGWWDWRFLVLIVFITGVNFFAGLALDREDRPARRKALLGTSVAASLGLLAVFKYFDFFVGSFVAMLGGFGLTFNFNTLGIILPVGISFYTFQAMSYTIDIYRRRIELERSPVRFATFVAFFPQLVAGPIVRAGTLLPQLKEDHPFDFDRFVSGFGLMLWGYIQKAAIADSLAQMVDVRFASPEAHSSLSLIIGILFYTFQIYCDFAGYSNIAIGFARILGFDFGRNFNRPYFSASFAEFWHRWHISLSTWLRDYLYIPLGGNRYGVSKTYRNLMLTMLLGGLWHGPNWTFVVWGFLHGLYLVIQRLTAGLLGRLVGFLHVPRTVTNAVAIALVFLLTSLTWVFFRAQTLGDALYMFERIASFDNLSFSGVHGRFHVVKGLALVGALWVVEAVSFKVDLLSVINRRPARIAICGALLLWTLALTGTFSNNAFIYFQF